MCEEGETGVLGGNEKLCSIGCVGVGGVRRESGTSSDCMGARGVQNATADPRREARRDDAGSDGFMLAIDDRRGTVGLESTYAPNVTSGTCRSRFSHGAPFSDGDRTVKSGRTGGVTTLAACG